MGARTTVTRTWLKDQVAALAAAGALSAALPVSAHHSWTASYLEDQTVSVEGEVVEVAYQNPHAWVHVSARDNSGRIQAIGAEWASPSRLSQQGIRMIPVLSDQREPRSRAMASRIFSMRFSGAGCELMKSEPLLPPLASARISMTPMSASGS